MSPEAVDLQQKKTYKPFLTIKGTSFLDPSSVVQLLSGSIHLKQHQLGTKKETQCIAQFTDGKMQYRVRIQAENLKRQPDEIKKATYTKLKH